LDPSKLRTLSVVRPVNEVTILARVTAFPWLVLRWLVAPGAPDVWSALVGVVLYVIAIDFVTTLARITDLNCQ
jgi:hypothetical protein